MPSSVPPVVRPGSLSSSTQPSLEGEGIVLRPWRLTDVGVVRMALADERIQRWNLLAGSSDADAYAWIRGWEECWRREAGVGWAALRPDGVPVGYVSLQHLHLAGGTARCSFWVLPEHRGHGWATHALGTAARWAFDVVGLYRLALAHSVANPASCRTASKAGFAAEGIRRSAVLHLDGWHDMHEHARVKEDPPGDCDNPADAF
ncbi:GNAT family N-acetyltransferase [Streptomyces sp. NPDC090442]|uniref:GNAT family N-acetyltransferase n=1 Tax=Streptomyces sp. NPDC090442 TaxID=3365962 RepID=UPI0038051FA1